jgi:hypothetical protein
VVVIRCARVFCVMGAREIFVNLSGPNAVSSLSDTIPSWRASWECPIHYTLRTRESLEPVWSGQQRHVDDVSFLEGACWYGCFRVFGVWWENTKGAAVTSHHRLVTSPLLSFIFFLGMFLLLPKHFLGFKLLYRCGCYRAIWLGLNLAFVFGLISHKST